MHGNGAICVYYLFILLKVFLTIENRLFHLIDQSPFKNDNGRRFYKFNRELDQYKDQLMELNLSFPPRYSSFIQCQTCFQLQIIHCFRNQRRRNIAVKGLNVPWSQRFTFATKRQDERERLAMRENLWLRVMQISLSCYDRCHENQLTSNQ